MHAGLGCRRGTRAVFFVIARSTAHRKEILIQKASAFSLCENVWANKRFLQWMKRFVGERPPKKYFNGNRYGLFEVIRKVASVALVFLGCAGK